MNQFIFIFFMLGINVSPKETIHSLALHYQTRGMQKHLLITADSTIVTINAERHSFKTKAIQWKKILKTMEQVKLNSISRLKRPSTKSFYDGAMAAQMEVITSKKTYVSIDFDHTQAPLMLSKTIAMMKASLKDASPKVEF